MHYDFIGYCVGVGGLIYTYLHDKKLKSAIKRIHLPKIRKLIDRMEEEKKVENIGTRQQTVMNLTQQDLEEMYKTLQITLNISE